ncbi:MAG: hypothetical protein H3C27_01955 [Opitutaceae bacterium]|nr:hypothetical protein [Opitutaceae bacterium]
MAWRIDEAVVRGEIDNRTRGHVTGRIWFTGRDEPVVLELAGNCWRDLAGRRLEFTNPQPKPGDLRSFAAVQRGAVGDITASRKVKVLEFPLDQMHLYYKTGREMPWHWGNSLYLEWFSEFNGRVVIESSEFELQIVGEAAWDMTEAEESEQRKANGRAMTGFMDRLVEAADAQIREEQDVTPPEWHEPPTTEAETEAEQARHDMLMDRIQARLEREGDDADYEQILEEEMARLDRERGEPEPTAEDLARNDEWMEEINRAADEALTNPDPESESGRRYEHPLVQRALELFHQLRGTAKTENWLPADAGPEHPVQELLNATMIAGGKLAGVLNRRQWPPDIEICAHVLVRLKRALEYLDDALRALESLQEENLVAPVHLGPVLVALTDLAHDVDALIGELRNKLERGTG